MHPDMLEGMAKKETSEILTEEEFLESVADRNLDEVYNMTPKLAEKILAKVPEAYVSIHPKHLSPDICKIVLENAIFPDSSEKRLMGWWRLRKYLGYIPPETWIKMSMELREKVATDEKGLALKIPGLSYEFWLNMATEPKRFHKGFHFWNVHSIQDIPEEHRTDELLLAFIKHLPSILSEMPEDRLNADFCMKAIKTNPDTLEFVPDGLLSMDIVLEALKNGGRIYKNLPLSMWNAETSVAALTNPKNIPMVPSDFMGEEAWRLSVRNGAHIFSVPKEFQTEDTCYDFIAVRISERNERLLSDRKSLTFDRPKREKMLAPLCANNEDFQLRVVTSMGIEGLKVLLHSIGAEISQKAWEKISEICPNSIRLMPKEFHTPEMIDRALSACKTSREADSLIGRINPVKLTKEHVPLMTGCESAEAICEDILKNGGLEERVIPEGTVLIQRYSLSSNGEDEDGDSMASPMTASGSA